MIYVYTLTLEKKIVNLNDMHVLLLQMDQRVQILTSGNVTDRECRF